MSKIAVIGAGVSGLVSAWILSQEHDVTLYEKEHYLGGHTNTQTATSNGRTLVADTGFMVFNHRTYPNMVRMFEHLGIDTIKTDMSFGVSSNAEAFEFSSDQVFVGARSYFSPKHWNMVLDIISFNRTVEKVAETLPDDFTVSQLLTHMKLGKEFVDKYLLPMSGAIWSTDKNKILEYPAKRFVTFFNNHGLLSPKTLWPTKRKEGRLQWYTVQNGASTYVEKIKSQLKVTTLTSRKVVSIKREDSKVHITDETGVTETYDAVVCAAHPDQTLSILDNPSETERQALATFAYSKNTIFMHKDTSVLLKKTKRWPSWAYKETPSGEVEISYYMNRLQSLPEDLPIIVTLNPVQSIKPEDTFFTTTYEHPLFSVETNSAQTSIQSLQGERNTWYAGAWLGYGFHEDGIRSALAVGEAFGLKAPWEKI